jgi:hypothetical protein
MTKPQSVLKSRPRAFRIMGDVHFNTTDDDPIVLVFDNKERVAILPETLKKLIQSWVDGKVIIP